jgi:hypothetical protein
LRQLNTEIALLEQVIADLLARHQGYAAIRQRPGAGRGDRRGDQRHPPLPGLGQLCSWAGLTRATANPTPS